MLTLHMPRGKKMASFLCNSHCHCTFLIFMPSLNLQHLVQVAVERYLKLPDLPLSFISVIYKNLKQ